MYKISSQRMNIFKLREEVLLQFTFLQETFWDNKECSLLILQHLQAEVGKVTRFCNAATKDQLFFFS
jgi:hypothetical protein